MPAHVDRNKTMRRWRAGSSSTAPGARTAAAEAETSSRSQSNNVVSMNSSSRPARHPCLRSMFAILAMRSLVLDSLHRRRGGMMDRSPTASCALADIAHNEEYAETDRRLRETRCGCRVTEKPPKLCKPRRLSCCSSCLARAQTQGILSPDRSERCVALCRELSAQISTSRPTSSALPEIGRAEDPYCPPSSHTQRALP